MKKWQKSSECSLGGGIMSVCLWRVYFVSRCLPSLLLISVSLSLFLTTRRWAALLSPSSLPWCLPHNKARHSRVESLRTKVTETVSQVSLFSLHCLAQVFCVSIRKLLNTIACQEGVAPSLHTCPGSPYHKERSIAQEPEPILGADACMVLVG